MDEEEVYHRKFIESTQMEIYRHKNNPMFCDIVIETSDDRYIYAHRIILSAAFPFLTEFMMGSGCDHLKLSRFNHDVVMAAINFAYFGKVNLTMNIASRLLLLAVTLRCRNLQKLCTTFITSNARINLNNVSALWTIGNMLHCEKMIKGCLNVMRSRIEHFSQDLFIWKHTETQGMSGLLDVAEVDRSDSLGDHLIEALRCWTGLADSHEEMKRRIESLIDFPHMFYHIKVLIYLYKTVIELNLPQHYQQKVAEEMELRYHELGDLSWLELAPREEGPQVVAIDIESTRCILSCLPVLDDSKEFERTFVRQNCANLVLFKDWICQIGGYDLTTKRILNEFQIFNFKNNQSFEGPSMYRARRNFAIAVNCTSIFALGGYNGICMQHCEYYNATQNQWKLLPRLNIGRHSAAAVCTHNCDVIVAGGNIKPGMTDETSTVEVLVSGHKMWEKLPDMHYAKGPLVMAYHNGQVFVSRNWSREHDYIERMVYPVQGMKPPQWTEIDLPSIIGRWQIRFFTFNKSLFLHYKDNSTIFKYHGNQEGRGDARAGESVWRPACQLPHCVDFIITRESPSSY